MFHILVGVILLRAHYFPNALVGLTCCYQCLSVCESKSNKLSIMWDV